MHKKDYIKLVGAIVAATKTYCGKTHSIDGDAFIKILCQILREDNPLFDETRFISAINKGPYEKFFKGMEK